MEPHGLLKPAVELSGGNTAAAGPGHLPKEPRFADGYCVGFETGRRAVVMLWRAKGEAAVSVPGDAECVDIVGRSVTERPVTISTAVVYLTGAAGSAQQMMDAVEPVG